MCVVVVGWGYFNLKMQMMFDINEMFNEAMARGHAIASHINTHTHNTPAHTHTKLTWACTCAQTFKRAFTYTSAAAHAFVLHTCMHP